MYTINNEKKMKHFKVTGTIKVFQMEAAWFYIDVPLIKVPKTERRGWGSVPIMATVGKTTWRTSIFPMKKDYYFIPLKKSVRKKEDMFEGDIITISYSVAQ